MKRMRRDMPYFACVGALLWIATAALAVAPPNGTGCPGTALAGGGPTATLSCGGAVCQGTGNCALGTAFPPLPTDKIQVYTFNGMAWVRAAGPPPNSTIAECVCKKVLPDGTVVIFNPAPACCHLVEITHADGTKQIGTRGSCFPCPLPGHRCFVTGQVGAPAIGEADCIPGP